MDPHSTLYLILKFRSEVVTPVHPTRPSTRHAGTRRGRPIADESAQASKRARTGTQAEGGKKDVSDMRKRSVSVVLND